MRQLIPRLRHQRLWCACIVPRHTLNVARTYNDAGHTTPAPETTSPETPYRPQWAQGISPQGRPLWQANALGLLRQTAYNSEGQPTHTGVYSRTMQRQRPLAPSNSATPPLALAQRSLRDDFGRTVYTQSPQHDGLGHSWRQYDNANRLVAMHDANGHSAHYHWDLQGRITRQEVWPATTATAATTNSAATPHTTTWQYAHAAKVFKVSGSASSVA